MDDLARARAATLAMWRADAQARPRGDWADLPGVQVHTTGFPVPQWNGAFVHGALTAPVLRDVATWFAARGMPYGVLVPDGPAVALPGLTRTTTLPLMLRALPAPTVALPDGYTLRADPSAGDLAAVSAEAFGDPYDVDLAFVRPLLRLPWNLVVAAYADGRPVACARAAVPGDVVGVFDVAVRTAHRGRGLGSAVTAAALALGTLAGGELAYLNQSPAGHGTYARLGFRDAPPWQVWSPSPERPGRPGQPDPDDTARAGDAQAPYDCGR